MRAEISGAPPGGIVTSTRIGRLGKGCACAAFVNRTEHARMARIARAIVDIVSSPAPRLQPLVRALSPCGQWAVSAAYCCFAGAGGGAAGAVGPDETSGGGLIATGGMPGCRGATPIAT